MNLRPYIRDFSFIQLYFYPSILWIIQGTRESSVLTEHFFIVLTEHVLFWENIFWKTRNIRTFWNVPRNFFKITIAKTKLQGLVVACSNNICQTQINMFICVLYLIGQWWVLDFDVEKNREILWNLIGGLVFMDNIKNCHHWSILSVEIWVSEFRQD